MSGGATTSHPMTPPFFSCNPSSWPLQLRFHSPASRELCLLDIVALAWQSPQHCFLQPLATCKLARVGREPHPQPSLYPGTGSLTNMGALCKWVLGTSLTVSLAPWVGHCLSQQMGLTLILWETEGMKRDFSLRPPNAAPRLWSSTLLSNDNLLSISMDLLIYTFYMKGIIHFVAFVSSPFTQHHVFRVHPCCHMGQPSFSFPSSIPLCGYATFYLPICQLKGIWVVSISWLL